MLAQQATGEVDEFCGRGEAGDTAVAVEVSADAHMLDAHHLHHVVEMGHCIQDAGLPVGAQEATVEGDLCHTAFGGEGAQLVIGEVAGMVAEGAA